jgi:UDP-N-acetyl-D-galactosamine dehydrogenase
MSKDKVGIVGLGYVGLPVALAFARKFPGTVGFDINEEKVSALRNKIDPNGEVTKEELEAPLQMTTKLEDLKGCNFYVVAVPTPVDEVRKPDLTPLIKASESLGKVLGKGSIVVYESTVYPGVTEEICGPVLESVSGLKRGKDFYLGYSPERINPGDKLHTLERIIKVVSGEDEKTLNKVAEMYGKIVDAGVYRAQSIKVAEAAKVIENTQRDLNMALMNELAIIFDRMGIRTKDVLDAASTKWNFVKFSPGLVGGHCIGVDPYYLTTKAEQLGYYPQVILAGRRINDSMGVYVAQRTVKMMVNKGGKVKGAKVGVLGLTFKEDVRDLRNSKVPDIINELKSYGVEVVVHDPHAEPKDAMHEYGVKLTDFEDFKNLDGLIIAVAHKTFKGWPAERLFGGLKNTGVVVDVKSCMDPSKVPAGFSYWSL